MKILLNPYVFQFSPALFVVLGVWCSVQLVLFLIVLDAEEVIEDVVTFFADKEAVNRVGNFCAATSRAPWPFLIASEKL